MKHFLLAVSVCILGAAAPQCRAQSNDELSAQLAQTILLQSETTNAEYRQRIAAAGGGRGTIAPTLPGTDQPRSNAPSVSAVYWQGGVATVQLTMADGRLVFANPGGVVGGAWRVSLVNGKGIVTRIHKGGANGR